MSVSNGSPISVTCIVPRLLPAVDGVGDYALCLSRQLRRDFGIETRFIIGDPKWVGVLKIEGFSVSRLNKRSISDLLSLLPTQNSCLNIVLLHYVGYGYAKRGCPYWLVAGLQKWGAGGDNRHLVTMFHEVYAFGPPWRSSFWLSNTQKNLAAHLAQISESCLTSKELYAQIIHKLSRGRRIRISNLSLFSNVGELKQALPLAERVRRAVVFGRRVSRECVYRKSLAELYRICRCLDIKEIWDIGPSTGLNLSSLEDLPIIQTGPLPAIEASNIFSNSFAGFLSCDPLSLAKSTIFAAYCAHRVLPVNFRHSPLVRDKIEAGKHYWFLGEEKAGVNNLMMLQTIADNAYAWYQTHNLAVHAKTFAEHLTGWRK